jgi:hypothetical protein
MNVAEMLALAGVAIACGVFVLFAFLILRPQ